MEEVNAEEDRAVKDVWVMVKLILIRSLDYRRVVYVVYIYTCYSCARSFDVRAEELDYIKTHSCLRFILFFFLKHRLEKKHVSQKSSGVRVLPLLFFKEEVCGGGFGALRINLTAQL